MQECMTRKPITKNNWNRQRDDNCRASTRCHLWSKGGNGKRSDGGARSVVRTFELNKGGQERSMSSG